MTTYSHSMMGTFEQCRLKFKLHYLDRAEPDFKNSIEAFMGSCVHDTLEKLYKDLKFQKIMTLQQVIDYFQKVWEEEYSDDIVIIKKDYTADNYRQTGEKCLIDYYTRFAPFDQETTIGLEMRVLMKIGPYSLQGYVDRISCTKDGTYIIHDYKTSSSLPTQEKIDEDRQLALYSIAIKEKYKDCGRIKLVWHYMAFDKDLESERTPEQREKLKAEIIKQIKEIENNKDYPPEQSALCSWCAYRSKCPEFKHLFKTEKKQQTLISDNGKSLVDEYEILSENKKEIEEKLDAIKDALTEYAKKEGITAVFGSKSKASVKSYPKLSFPKKDDPRQKDFIDAVKKIGLFDELGTVDVYELAKKINRKDIHEDLIKIIEPYITKSETNVVRLSKK